MEGKEKSREQMWERKNEKPEERGAELKEYDVGVQGPSAGLGDGDYLQVEYASRNC